MLKLRLNMPPWTPLSAHAAGLVTDIGGIIPAVSGTGNAPNRIKDGQRIEVDGHAGTVTLLSEPGAKTSQQLDRKV